MACLKDRLSTYVFWICIIFLYLTTGGELIDFASAAERNSGRMEEIKPTYFGMHIHSLLRKNSLGRFATWPEVAFGAWRLHDTYTKWADLERAKGQWDFSLLDKYIDIAEAHGVEVLLTLGHPPRWASARPEEPTYTYGLGSAAEPANISDWENYIRTVATRYRGRIRAYEIWNEPWFQEVDKVTRADGKAAFFSGSIVKMIELAQIAYRTIKEIDPNARVVAPGFDGEESGVRRLDLYLKMGGAAVSDVIAFHLYVPTPERIPQLVQKIRAVMNRYGLGAHELWNTESGYITENPDEPNLAPKGRALNGISAAAYVLRSLLLGAGSGVQRYYWYAWDNGLFGLTDGRGRTVNLAGKAYAQARRWIEGTTVRNCVTNVPGVWTCELWRGTRTAIAIWNVSDAVEWKIPSKSLQVETWDGATTDIKPGQEFIKIGPMPVLLKSDRLPWSNASIS